MSSQNETTNIDDLPSVGGTNGGPVQNVFSESNTENIKIPNYGQQLNSEKEVVPALQNIDFTSKLSSSLKDVTNNSGEALQLPSRDIPQNQSQVHNDIQTKVNYIPEKDQVDYIKNYISQNDIIQQNNEKKIQSDKTDEFYEKIQMPLIVSLLYFIFQLPVVRKNLFIYLPSLFNKDGNANLSGYIFNSVVFGILYFSFTHILNYISI